MILMGFGNFCSTVDEQVFVQGENTTDEGGDREDTPDGVDVGLITGEELDGSVKRSANFRATRQDLLDDGVRETLEKGAKDATGQHPDRRGMEGSNLKGDLIYTKSEFCKNLNLNIINFKLLNLSKFWTFVANFVNFLYFCTSFFQNVGVFIFLRR